MNEVTHLVLAISRLDLTRELATGRDYDRLQFIWDGWRASVGPQLRSLYQEFVELSNEAAVANGEENHIMENLQLAPVVS